jgi:hypothetical protein
VYNITSFALASFLTTLVTAHGYDTCWIFGETLFPNNFEQFSGFKSRRMVNLQHHQS